MNPSCSVSRLLPKRLRCLVRSRQTIMRPSLPVGGQTFHILHPLELQPRSVSVRAKLDESRKWKISVRAPFRAHEIARRNVTDLEHAIVPAGPTGTYHRFRHQLIFETQCKLEARLTRLANLQLCAAYAVDVTDAQIRLTHSLNTKVFAESSRNKRCGMLR